MQVCREKAEEDWYFDTLILIRNLEVRDIGDINVHKINNTVESEMINNDHSRHRNHSKTSVREILNKL